MIRATKLSKRYGSVTALNDITFGFDGGVCGLVGPNAAGKSTLLKILVGLLRPDTGRVSVLGLEPFTQRENLLQRLGVMHERPVFPKWATARQYLRFAASLRCMKDWNEAVTEASRLARIDFALNREISGYSGGMVKRLALADALLGNPELIVMDEPTANLDPLSRKTFLEDINGLAKEHGVSLLLSTHLLPDLEKVCTTLIILHEGKLVAYGTPNELAGFQKGVVFEAEGERIGDITPRLRQDNIIERKVGDGWLRITASDPDIFIQDFNHAVQDLKLTVTSFGRVTPSLEDIYMRAIRNGSKAA